jgi:arabinan endo-1,5-alpha-L-arabinosidase
MQIQTVYRRNATSRVFQTGAALAAFALTALTGCSNPNSTITPVATSTSLTTSATSVNIGTSLTFTSTLTGGSTTNKPTGVIQFLDSANELAVDSLQNGYTVSSTVLSTTTVLAPGAHSITAFYFGDPYNAASTSAATALNVYQPTTISLAYPSQKSPILYAQNSPVTLISTITAGTYAPTGNVTFSTGGTTLGTAPIVATQQGNQTIYNATFTSSSLPIGKDEVVATYTANNYQLQSQSAPVLVEVHGALVPTTVAIASSPTTSSALGSFVTLTGTVTPTTASAFTLDGTISFFDGATLLGTGTISNGSSASISTKQFTPGSNSLTAVYNGDVFYGSSTSSAEAFNITPYTGPTYTNPLTLTAGSLGQVYNCPDPSVIKYQTGGADTWYAYCTGDTMNANDTVTPGGAYKQHLITIFSSTDLVHWTYVRDAFTSIPSWAAPNQEFTTPAIAYFGGQYHLYYTATNATAINASFGLPTAIGVGTAATPAGPFTDAGAPVVPASLGCGGCANFDTQAPSIVNDNAGNNWIVFGGPLGGIILEQLNSAGTAVVTSTSISIGVDNFATDPYIFYNANTGYFYEFLSAGGCCSGAISSLNVRVGRSQTITGPYFDKEGNDLNAYTAPGITGDPGGDIMLAQNGNDIVGSGSNTVITDESGQTYVVYSGVSQNNSTVPNYNGFLTARQLMIDPLDWSSDGWPTARGGNGPSDYTIPQPIPAAQPGATNAYVEVPNVTDTPGTEMTAYSDEFNETSLNTAQWSFIHLSAPYSMTGSAYAVNSVNAESTIQSSMPFLPILSEPEPAGNYMLEVKLASSDPATGYIFNNNQGGIFIYNNDGDYLRLDQFPEYETRQIEFLDQAAFGIVAFAPGGDPNFGASTYMRLAKRVGNGAYAWDTYTAYSSVDGVNWVKGPTWIKPYGSGNQGIKIGLFAGNTAGYTASFDYIHVSTLLP